MEFKFIFIVIAAFIIASGNSSGLRDQNTEAAVVEIAKATFQTINTKLNETLAKVTPDVEQLLRALDVLQSEYLRAAEKVVLETIENRNSTLNWKSVLFYDDFNVAKCLNDLQSRLSWIQSEIINTTTNCLQTAARPVADDTVAVFSAFTRLDDEIQEQAIDLDECQQSDAVLDCMQIVIRKLVKFALDAPAEVQFDNDRTQNNYDALQSAFQNCLDDAASIVGEKMSEIDERIEVCGYSFGSWDGNDDDYLEDLNNNGNSDKNENYYDSNDDGDNNYYNNII